MRELRSWQTGWRLLIWIFTGHSPLGSVEWRLIWQRVLISDISASDVRWHLAPPSLLPKWALRLVTGLYFPIRFWLDWSAEPYRHLPTVQCYHSNCNIIENHSTHAILNASLKFSITAFARVQAQVWLLRVTNNSLELTLTYEGLRVWPGQ